MRLGQSSFVYLGSRIVASVVSFFATVYFTRLLGETVYGYFVITLSLVSWLSIFKDVGFGSAMIKRISEGEEPYAYLTAGVLIQVGLILPVVVGVLIFRPQVNGYVGQPVAKFVALLLVISILKGLVNNLLHGTHRVHTSAILGTASDLVQNVIMVALVFLGWRLTGMLSGYALGAAIISFVGILIVRPRLEWPRRAHLTQLWNYAKFSWLGSIQSKTFHRVDILVLGFFVSAGLTGIYGVAYTLGTFLELFGNSISNVLFPEMSKQSAQNNTEKIGSLTNDALMFSGLFLIPGVVGAAVIGDRLLRIYGTNFDKGHWILVILLVALFIYTYTKQLLSTLNAIDRPDLAFRANGLFIGTNIILNFVLVWAIGWYGAAVATAVSAAVGLGAAYYYVRKFILVDIPVAGILRQVAAAGVMGVVVLGTSVFAETNINWINDYNSIFVVLLVGFGSVVYFAVLFFISTRFRMTVNDNIPNRFRDMLNL